MSLVYEDFTQAGAAQFAFATALTSFAGGVLPGAGDQTVCLCGYSYTTGGSAHTAQLVLVDGAVANPEDRVYLVNETALTYFSWLGSSPLPFQLTTLRFETSGKTATGTLRVWYKVGLV